MKNVNKNDLKNILKGVVIGGLIFGGIGVSAVTLTAAQIKYTPSDEKFKATNAEEALNEIYKIAEYKIPADTYFYEDGTEGDSATIVRYKKVGDKYFVCDENGIVAEGTDATDVTSKTLIPYTATTARNLSAGTAGYASNSFILGDGSDADSELPFNNFDNCNHVALSYNYMMAVKSNTAYTHTTNFTIEKGKTYFVSLTYGGNKPNYEYNDISRCIENVELIVGEYSTENADYIVKQLENSMGGANYFGKYIYLIIKAKENAIIPLTYTAKFANGETQMAINYEYWYC